MDFSSAGTKNWPLLRSGHCREVAFSVGLTALAIH